MVGDVKRRGRGSTSPVRRPGVVLAALCAADFLVVLDGLIVAVALPTVQRALDIPAGSLPWVINAYVLCFGGFLLLGGRLGDLYGRRRVLVTGLLLFAGGSVLAGLAWGTPVLLAGRAVQGLAAALMAPAALALLIASFAAGPARNRALGLWSAAGSVGIPVGALLGGLLTATWGWRWVLLINAPAALLAAALTWRAVPESTDPTAPRRLDLPGAVLVTAGVTLLVLAVVQTERAHGPAQLAWRVLLPAVAGVVLLVAFGRVERRSAQALIPLRILRVPALRSANLVGSALPIGLGAALFLGSLYLQRVLGYGPLATGWAYLALALPVIAASPLASRLVSTLGHRPVAVGGLLLQAAGLALLAPTPLDATFATDVLPGFLLVGLGAPLAFVPTTAAAMAAAPQESGLSSGIFNTAQQLGNALALAGLATLAAARTSALLGTSGSEPEALAAGYRAGFLLGAALLALAAVAALRLGPSTSEQ